MKSIFQLLAVGCVGLFKPIVEILFYQLGLQVAYEFVNALVPLVEVLDHCLEFANLSNYLLVVEAEEIFLYVGVQFAILIPLECSAFLLIA